MNLNNEVLQRLDALADKLGTTGAHLWAVLVREARVEAVLDSLVALVMLVLTAGGIYAVRWYVRKEKKYGDDYIIVLIIGLLVAVLAAIVFFPFAYSAGIGFANPEYVALDKLITAVKR